MKRIFLGLSVVAAVAMAQSVSATVITLTFGTEFSGSGDTLSGDVVVTLDDEGGSGSVDVKVDTTGLDGSLSEFISGLYLNLDPALDPTDLGIGFDGGAIDPTGVSLGTDAFQADGDGLYDILIDWPTSPPRFTAGLMDTITFTLSGLEAEHFNFLSTPAGGTGPFVAALRAQSLGEDGEGSGWFFPTIEQEEEDMPEPTTVLLIGVGLLSAGLAGRRRRP